MCLTDVNPDVLDTAGDQPSPGREYPGVAWGKAADPSVHPVKDLADQVH